jgi:APA family basic amino acid/polyamine antiporter
MPVLGAVVCLILALPITGRDTAVYTRVGVLIAIGVVLWFINRLYVGRVKELDATQIT